MLWLFASVLLIVFSILIVVSKAKAGIIQYGTTAFILASIERLQSSAQTTLMLIAHQYESSLFATDIFKVFDWKPHLEQKGNYSSVHSGMPRVVFENVRFAYPGSELLVLRDFNLTIEPNQKLAVLGKNGAGKTTMMKLLCRFYDPTSGRITVNGVDLRDIDIDVWLKMLGIIFQDYSDYTLTVRKNIALGDSSIDLDQDRVVAAADLAQASSFIKHYDLGYDQMIGRTFTNGVEPSKGQRQRLALARLFYRDPAIMVLDEPTAAVDAEAEMKIFDYLESLGNQTVIVVSQRYSTVKNADKIIVIDNGMIVEEGNHEQLMEDGNNYARLFMEQAARYS